MAKITDYVADGTKVGQTVEVKAKKFVWVKVGQGTVSAISDDEVAVDGKISILGYSGDLNIHLNLTNADPDAEHGPVRLAAQYHCRRKCDLQEYKRHIDRLRRTWWRETEHQHLEVQQWRTNGVQAFWPCEPGCAS